MKTSPLFFANLLGVGFLFLASPGQAAPQQQTGLTTERLNDLDKLGAFTPDFKRAVHDYVEAKQAIATALKDKNKYRDQLPGIEKQAETEEAKVAELQQKLAEYDHTAETDFILVQKKMSDKEAVPEEQLILVQTYVWCYPMSTHKSEAQMYLQQVQKVLADRAQAQKDAIAAEEAAHAKLLARVQSHDLSRAEWNDFLRNMSQEEVLKYLGRPQMLQGSYWIYIGAWMPDPLRNRKVGLRINFNAARVISVVESEASNTAIAPVAN